MALLKEDGSLDIEWLDSLPLEEHDEIFSTLTHEQINEYWSKVPLNESKYQKRYVVVDYTLEDELKRGAVIAEDFLKEQREKYGIK